MENEVNSIVYTRHAEELGMDPSWVHIFPMPGLDGYYVMFYAEDPNTTDNPMVTVGPQEFAGYASLFDICNKLLDKYHAKYLNA